MRFTIIDGHAVAYRQYHALKPEAFSTSSGEPTNATYGFARTLLDIIKAEEPPHYLAVTFDAGLSGRDQVYTEYKGTREDMAMTMAVQMHRIRQLVEAFNIPILERAGFEADDVIGSAARRIAAERGDDVEVYILTGDHDLLQLVNEHVVVHVQKPYGDFTLYHVSDVMDRYGIPPERLPDYKGLVGDNSDNIPGVMGIGDKGAKDLLQKFGSLDGIYANLDEIKPATRKKLEEGRDSAFLSRQLATIRTDLPLDLDIEKCVAHDFDPMRVAQLFGELEFRSLIKRLGLNNSQTLSAPPPNNGNGSQQMSLFGDGDIDPGTAPVTTIAPGDPIPEVVPTIIVNTEEHLAELVRVLESASAIAFDTETDSPEQIKARLVGISLSVDGETGYYVPVGHITPAELHTQNHKPQPPVQLPMDRVIEALRPALTNPAIPKYAHNAVYDLLVMQRHGIDVTPITFDTMVAKWMQDPEKSKGLKEQAWNEFQVSMTPIEALIGKGGKNQLTMDRVSIERAAPYAAADAVLTYRLVGKHAPRLEEQQLTRLFSEVEMPLVPVIVELDRAGALLDLPYLKELGVELGKRLDALAEQIYGIAGSRFNIGSPKQLNEVLFDRMNISTKGTGLRKSSHGYSVDAKALEALSEHHEIARLIMDWRSLEKLRGTYVDSLPKIVDPEGRIHTSYNQTGSVTGRISSDSPNLQNIPIRTDEGRRVRKAFIAPAGYRLLGVDYSQIELRILAHLSASPFLIDAFRTGKDIHAATAAAMYDIPYEDVAKEQRYLAKRINFGLIYGMGAHRLAQESELSFKEASAFIEKYFQEFGEVKAYLDGMKILAQKQGYLTTVFGRRKRFDILNDPNLSKADRARIEREAINMPIQGTNADLIKIAMIRISRRLKQDAPDSRLILQVHDELVLEVPEKDVEKVADLVRNEMENAHTQFGVEFSVPIRAEAKVGENWAEMTVLPD
jgi:DNA polymerase I